MTETRLMNVNDYPCDLLVGEGRSCFAVGLTSAVHEKYHRSLLMSKVHAGAKRSWDAQRRSAQWSGSQEMRGLQSHFFGSVHLQTETTNT